MNLSCPVEISARHLHLSQADADLLFGPNYQLVVAKELSQKGEFASKDTVAITFSAADGKEYRLEKVRVVGPIRPKTQLEISLTDAHSLKALPPVRLSGNVEGSLGFKIIGPFGEVVKNEGLIIAQRHLHLNPTEASELNLKDHDTVQIKAGSPERQLIFDQVPVRIKDNYLKTLHLDTDEGNACGISTKGMGEIVK